MAFALVADLVIEGAAEVVEVQHEVGFLSAHPPRPVLARAACVIFHEADQIPDLRVLDARRVEDALFDVSVADACDEDVPYDGFRIIMSRAAIELSKLSARGGMARCIRRQTRA